MDDEGLNWDYAIDSISTETSAIGDKGRMLLDFLGICNRDVLWGSIGFYWVLCVSVGFRA